MSLHTHKSDAQHKNMNLRCTQPATPTLCSLIKSCSHRTGLSSLKLVVRKTPLKCKTESSNRHLKGFIHETWSNISFIHTTITTLPTRRLPKPEACTTLSLRCSKARAWIDDVQYFDPWTNAVVRFKNWNPLQPTQTFNHSSSQTHKTQMKCYWYFMHRSILCECGHLQYHCSPVGVSLSTRSHTESTHLYCIVSDVVEALSLVMRILTMLKRKTKFIYNKTHRIRKDNFMILCCDQAPLINVQSKATKRDGVKGGTQIRPGHTAVIACTYEPLTITFLHNTFS